MASLPSPSSGSPDAEPSRPRPPLSPSLSQPLRLSGSPHPSLHKTRNYIHPTPESPAFTLPLGRDPSAQPLPSPPGGAPVGIRGRRHISSYLCPILTTACVLGVVRTLP